MSPMHELKLFHHPFTENNIDGLALKKLKSFEDFKEIVPKAGERQTEETLTGEICSHL